MADDDRRSVGVRVRPNSHDFIRQLRQDLAGKKYTFYVDVHANMSPATRDVRAWAAGPLQKIHASVPVSANTGPASRDMADWRRRQAGIRTTVKVNADTSAAMREIEMVRAAAKDVTIRVKADAQRARSSVERAASGGGRARPSGVDKEFETGLKKGVDAALARLDEVRAEAKKPVQVGLELDPSFDFKLRRRLADIKAKVKADPVELPIETEIKGLERSIMAAKIVAKSNKLQVPVEYDPTDVKQMRLQLTKLRLLEEANDIKLNVKVTRSSLEQAKDAMDRVGKQFGKFNLIRSLDVGPFNLGKPSGLIGTVSTLTILAGLLPGVTAGSMALADGLTRLAGAAALAPGAIGALAASLATLSIGTKGIGDAFDSLMAMWDEGASQQGKSSMRMVSAQNNYTNAVVDEQRAQERVADARRDALGELRNLNNELRGGVLNEAQALLDLQKAKDRYAQGDFDNNTERLQGLLDIQRAQLNVDTTREDNLTLQQKANDAQAKGVEGSDAVRDALDGQRRAAEATTAALEALNAGGAGATTAAQKFQDQLSQLSPNAQDFILTIAGMKDELYGFRNAIQDTIFQGAGPAFRDMFTDLMPIIEPGMQQIAQGLNSNLLQVFDTLKSPDGQSIIERILGGTADTQQAISGLINPLITGVGTLVAAGTEKMPQVVELFTRLAERFSIFIQEADRNGTLDTFLDKGVGALADMAEIGLNLIQIVNDLSEAFGGNILTDIKSLTDSWHEFLSSEEGQQKLKDFLQEAKDLWAEWKPIIMELPATFAAVSDAAHNVLDYLLPTIQNILGFLNKFPGALEVIATSVMLSRLLGSFSTLATTVGGIMTALRTMPGLINKIPGVSIPVPAAAGAGAAAAGPGLGATIAGAGAAGAPVAGVTLPLIIGGLAAGVAGTAVLNQGRDIALPTGDVGGSGVTVLQGDADAKKKRAPAGVPQPDSDEARKAVEAGVAGNDPTSKWVAAATDPEDWKKRYLWAVNHPNESKPGAFKPPDSYLTGGYTDWGVKTGRIAELHGGEYVQPHQTVNHYGVGAMKAVHDKRAVISYSTGGSVPTAYPGNPQVPYGGVGGVGGGLGWYIPGVGFLPGAEGDLGPGRSPFAGRDTRTPWRKRMGPRGRVPIISRAGGGPIPTANPNWELHDITKLPVIPRDASAGPSIESVWGPDGMPTYRIPDSARAGARPGQAGGYEDIPGWTTRSPVKDVTDVQGAYPWLPGTQINRGGIGGHLGSFAEGGLVYDPATGQYVQTGAAVSHGLGGAPAGPGIINTLASGVEQGVAHAGNVASQVASVVQQVAAPSGAPGGPDVPGSPGYTGMLGTPPGPAPGSIDTATTAAPSSLADSFLGALGIPGLGGQNANTGPGWGEGGPPIGLGGGEPGPNGEAPFDIRKFGIGPGPLGSGPADWLNFTGQQLGSFGSGLFTTFASGILGGLGLSGLSSYVQSAGGVADHFATAGLDDKSKAQGPGAADTNAAVADLLGTEAGIPSNPAYPGVPGLPNVFDPGSGSALPGGGGKNGLQPATARGKDIIQKLFPWATNIGGVRADALKWHPSGLALDVMTDPGHGNNDPPSPEGLAKGNQLYAWLKANQKALGIDYILWQEKDHFNHLHVNFAPSGPQGSGGGMMPAVTAPTAPNNPPWIKPVHTAPTSQPLIGPSTSSMSLKPVGDPKKLFGPGFYSGGMVHKVMDRGGVIGPGTTVVHNYTGQPELVVPSFAPGGLFSQAAIIPKPVPAPPPRPPNAIAKVPPPVARTPTAAPKPNVPTPQPGAVPPPVAPVPHGGAPAPPGPAAPVAQGPSGAPIAIGGGRPATGAGPGAESGDHVHPALRKGITSGFAAAGQAASTAIAIAASLAAGAGSSGFSPGASAVGALGAIGPYVQGLFMQGGKIANNAANVASSFLVGNITGGTTENPYGVTQRGSVPGGGTKVVDSSNNQYGDIYTNNLEEYFTMVDRRNAQKAQSGLGRWGSQI